MKNLSNITNLIILLSLISLCACSGVKGRLSLYKIKSHINLQTDHSNLGNDTIHINPENFFSSRIFEYKTGVIEGNGNSESDLLYREFEFQGINNWHKTKNYDVIEETYLYLDNFDRADNGRAIYFLTYPMMDKHNRNKYFGREKNIDTNSLRDLLVGYWSKADSSVYMVFLTGKNKFFGLLKKKNLTFRAQELRDNKNHVIGIGISGVTHPSSPQIPKNETFSLERVIKNTTFIDLGSTLFLPDTTFMFFSKINKKRDFRISKHLSGDENNVDLRIVRAMILNDEQEELTFKVNGIQDPKYYKFHKNRTYYCYIDDSRNKLKLIKKRAK